MSKAAPGPYETVDVGNGATSFHTYVVDKNGRKIGVAWGPTDEKVWTAALWAAAPELLAAAEELWQATVNNPTVPEYARAAVRQAISKATGS